jgi:hypothetical protein
VLREMVVEDDGTSLSGREEGTGEKLDSGRHLFSVAD